MTGFWAQVREITIRDVRLERRAGEVLWITVPFGAVSLLLIPLAVGADTPLLREIGPGLYWVIVMLFGVLISVRRTSAETPAQRDALALLGVDPAAAWVGRVIAGTSLLLVFQIVVGAVAILLYDIRLDGWLWLMIVVPLAAIGLGSLGAIAGSITASLNASAALVPLVVAPLAVPLLLGATEGMDSIQTGGGILPWILLMVVVDLVLAIAGVLSARPLQETQ
jgi:heme exporter protein B